MKLRQPAAGSWRLWLRLCKLESRQHLHHPAYACRLLQICFQRLCRSACMKRLMPHMPATTGKRCILRPQPMNSMHPEIEA